MSRQGISVDRVSARITAEALGIATRRRHRTAARLHRRNPIFGQRIATPALQVQILRPAERSILPRNSDFGVGLFGAIELQMHAGPVFVDHDYETQAKVLAIGETPKTEYLYYEASLFEPGSDDNSAQHDHDVTVHEGVVETLGLNTRGQSNRSTSPVRLHHAPPGEDGPTRKSALGPIERIDVRHGWREPNKQLELARPQGLEPRTPRFEAWCSIQLSYGRSEAISKRRSLRRCLLKIKSRKRCFDS